MTGPRVGSGQRRAAGVAPGVLPRPLTEMPFGVSPSEGPSGSGVPQSMHQQTAPGSRPLQQQQPMHQPQHPAMMMAQPSQGAQLGVNRIGASGGGGAGGGYAAYGGGGNLPRLGGAGSSIAGGLYGSSAAVSVNGGSHHTLASANGGSSALYGGGNGSTAANYGGPPRSGNNAYGGGVPFMAQPAAGIPMDWSRRPAR